MMKPKRLTRVEEHLRHELRDPHFAESYAVELIKAKIAQELISVRVKERLTQLGLAKRIGVSQQQISKIENGEFESIEVVIRVLMALKHRMALTLPPAEIPLRIQHA